MNRKRHKSLYISKSLLTDLIQDIAMLVTKDGRILTFRGIPDYVNLLAIHNDISRDALLLVIQSEEFPEVPEGGVAEDLMVTVRESYRLEMEGPMI